MHNSLNHISHRDQEPLGTFSKTTGRFAAKENGNNYSILWYIMGLYRDNNGKENGNYYLGFRV